MGAAASFDLKCNMFLLSWVLEITVKSGGGRGNQKHWDWKHGKDSLQWGSKPSLCGDLKIPLTLKLVAISLQEELGSHWVWRFYVTYDKGRNYGISLKSQQGWRCDRCGGVKGMKQMHLPTNDESLVHWLAFKGAYSWEQRQAFSWGLGLWAQRSKAEVDAQLSWNRCDC